MAEQKAETKATSTSVKDSSRKSSTKAGNKGFVADRESDRNPTHDQQATETRDTLGRDTTGVRSFGELDRGEKLAAEAVEKRARTGGDTKIVEKNGVRSAVTEPVEDHSDNGKVYKDARINPPDTNAPDAGLTPDGRRIAE